MKVYMCNDKKNYWFDKVDWKKVVFCFVICFICFFLFFYFFIGNENYLERAISTSLLLSYLISFCFIIHYLIDNRICVYVIRDKKMYVLFPHSFSREYEDSLISYSAFKKIVSNSQNIEKILNHDSLFWGIDLFEVENIEYSRKSSKHFVVKASGIFFQWTFCGRKFAEGDYELKKSSATKKFVIPSDYSRYEELLDFLSK